MTKELSPLFFIPVLYDGTPLEMVPVQDGNWRMVLHSWRGWETWCYIAYKDERRQDDLIRERD